MAKKIITFISLIVIILSFSSFSFATEAPNIDCPSAILIDASTGKILYEKNIHQKMYPASLTKILTAVLVLDNCSMEEIVTMSYNSVMSLEYGYVTANLEIGEELTVEQLLNLLMVSSANDVAIALAEHVSGSVEAFADLMNKKAEEIGCTESHFTNSAGIHDENHYSTAYDLALIGKYAMKYDKIRELVRKTYYTLDATNKYSGTDRVYTTTNEILLKNNNNRQDNYYYKYATGMKTGFTSAAGYCLMCSSEKDNFCFISVVLGGGQTKDGLSARYIDTKALMEYGYSQYSLKQLAQKGNVIQTININNATKETKKLDLIIDKDIFVTVPVENFNSAIDPQISLIDNLKAPIEKNAIVGEITYSVDGIDYTANLLAANYVKPSRIILKFVILLILITCIIGFLRIKVLKEKRKRLSRIKKMGA